MDDHYDTTKTSVLAHIQQLFQEMEDEMAISHQEKFALLEDAFENASDSDELKVAFDQWYHDHADDIEFDHDSDELWEHALVRADEADDDDEFDEDEDDDMDDEDEDDEDLM